MRTMITVTSKGQVSLPAAVRKAMRLQDGDKLVFSYNSELQTATIAKPLTIEQLSDKISNYVKPGTKPVLDAGEYYGRHRKPRV